MAQSQHFSVVHVQHNGTYMLVISKPKRRQCNNKQTTKNINELTKTNHFDR
jgi:hypothetical protein